MFQKYMITMMNNILYIITKKKERPDVKGKKAPGLFNNNITVNTVLYRTTKN